LAALDNTISKITVKLGGVVTGILYLQVDQNLDTCQEMGDDDLVEELKKSLAGEVEQDSGGKATPYSRQRSRESGPDALMLCRARGKDGEG